MLYICTSVMYIFTCIHCTMNAGMCEGVGSQPGLRVDEDSTAQPRVPRRQLHPLLQATARRPNTHRGRRDQCTAHVGPRFSTYCTCTQMYMYTCKCTCTCTQNVHGKYVYSTLALEKERAIVKEETALRKEKEAVCCYAVQGCVYTGSRDGLENHMHTQTDIKKK